MANNNSGKTILVTGGSGFVGSHCVLELLEHDYQVVVVDNLVNSVQLKDSPLPESLIRVQEITGKRVTAFYNGNIGDSAFLASVFKAHQPVDVVMHFAALKSVGESVSSPLAYYRNNVAGTITLLETMQQFGVKKFIFSSSATVYGSPSYLPLDERHPIGQSCSNPYGKSKFVVETMLADLAASDPAGWSIVSLRYFNPVGAHPSGRIGEDPAGIPNNLMPFITQVAAGRRPQLSVFGDDYETPDGSAIRDYIHVLDLSDGHIVALEKMLQEEENWKGYHALNLGSGNGVSVFQVIAAFEKATGVKIPFKVVGRRPGDVPAVFADARLAEQRLGWKTKHSIEEMCASAWNWQSQNPKGFAS